MPYYIEYANRYSNYIFNLLNMFMASCHIIFWLVICPTFMVNTILLRDTILSFDLSVFPLY